MQKHRKVAPCNLLSSPPTTPTRCPRPPLVDSEASGAASDGRGLGQGLALACVNRSRSGGGGGRAAAAAASRGRWAAANWRPRFAARSAYRPRGAVDQVPGGAAARSGRAQSTVGNQCRGRRAPRARFSRRQDIRGRERYVGSRATICGSQTANCPRDLAP